MIELLLGILAGGLAGFGVTGLLVRRELKKAAK